MSDIFRYCRAVAIAFALAIPVVASSEEEDFEFYGEPIEYSSFQFELEGQDSRYYSGYATNVACTDGNASQECVVVIDSCGQGQETVYSTQATKAIILTAARDGQSIPVSLRRSSGAVIYVMCTIFLR